MITKAHFDFICNVLKAITMCIQIFQYLRNVRIIKKPSFWLQLLQFAALIGIFASPIQYLPLQCVLAMAYVFCHVYSIRLSIAEGVPWFSIAVLLSTILLLSVFLSWRIVQYVT